MISVTFTADVENIVATEHLYQWDNGQKLSISGVGITADIHFANKKSEKALVVTPTVTSGAMEAPIPNSLLAEPYPIIAYVYVPSDDGARTIKTITIFVEARKQPSDFILEEDEGITTIETISQRANEVLQNATNQINTAVSNMNADYGNFKTTIQSELADMVANTTIPNADTVDGLHANEIANNPNLLINPDFRINQRGKDSYTGTSVYTYTVDQWYIWKYNCDAYGTVSVNSDGSLSVDGANGASDAILSQDIENGAKLVGKTVTLSMEIEEIEGTINAQQHYNSSSNLTISEPGVHKVTFMWQEATKYRIVINNTNCSHYKIKWIKLEPGSIATAFTPPDPTMELLKIQAKDGTIHAKTADTANTAGTLATTPTNVCLRNISFGTANPQVTDSSAEGYVAEGALYGQYV